MIASGTGRTAASQGGGWVRGGCGYVSIVPESGFHGKSVPIFTLPGGGSIRDTGKELYFSAHDEKAHGVALVYAALTWGKNVVVEQGKIMYCQTPEIRREQERGWSR